MTDEEKRLKSQYAADPEALYSKFVSDKPTYAGTYEQPLGDLHRRISTRQPFSYDAARDPLWKSAKDQYIQGGKMAMRDTMGQTAALTGGYGSTYSQSAGQQAYDAYLQDLSGVGRELAADAYGRYQDEGDALARQYTMLGDLRDTEYSRYLQDVADWQSERAYQAQTESEQYNRQQANYANLYSLIMSSGYQPSESDLAAAGMTPEQAEAMRQTWIGANPAEAYRLGYITAEDVYKATGKWPVGTAPASSSGGGGTRYHYANAEGLSVSDIKRIQTELGLEANGVWGPNTEAAYNAAVEENNKNKLKKPGGGTLKVNMTK